MFYLFASNIHWLIKQKLKLNRAIGSKQHQLFLYILLQHLQQGLLYAKACVQPQ